MGSPTHLLMTMPQTAAFAFACEPEEVCDLDALANSFFLKDVTCERCLEAGGARARVARLIVGGDV